MRDLFPFEAEEFEFETYGRYDSRGELLQEYEATTSGYPDRPRTARSDLESVLLRSAIRNGTTDENQLTDLIFFRRHPERNGRPIARSEPNAQQLSIEWIELRDRLVKPALTGTPPIHIPSTGPIRSPAILLPVVGMEKTSSAFREKVIRIAKGLETDPNYLMAIMSFESGFDPAARNASSGATGLIQFMSKTAQELGVSIDALARMSAEQQLDYVAKYFAPYKGRLKTLEDAYMAVLYRPAVGSAPGHVLFRTDDPNTSTAYRQNSLLDVNKDGRITVAEATSFVRKRFINGAGELGNGFLEFTEFPEFSFGELIEEESDFVRPSSDFPSGLESTIVRSAIRNGTTDENSLTDLIFFRRHPERNGLALSQREPDFQRLSQEWLSIRDTVVKPNLGSTTRPRPAPTPGRPDIVTVRRVFRVARQIAPKVEALLAAAEADGVRLGHSTSFRTLQDQIALRKKYCGLTHFDIWEKPSSQCEREVAIPGTSNHEKGLAIDFTYNDAGMSRDDPGFRWLSANAGRYGFSNLTSEPWHWSVDGH